MAAIPLQPRPAATLLFIRDSADGIEVFMVVRNAGLSFAANAMVFPGGKLIAADHPDAMGTALLPNHGLDTLHTAHAVAALREAFEEAGLLLAQRTDGSSLEAGVIRGLDPYRRKIDAGEADFGAVLRDAGLAISLSEVVPFAHIIAPTTAPRRFDTRFFVAPAPADQVHRVDDHEIIEAQWITADAAIALGDSDMRLIMHPTRLVLSRLQRFGTVAEALVGARAEPPTPILPEVQTRGGERGLYSPCAPGIDESWEVLDSRSALRRGIPGEVT